MQRTVTDLAVMRALRFRATLAYVTGALVLLGSVAAAWWWSWVAWVVLYVAGVGCLVYSAVLTRRAAAVFDDVTVFLMGDGRAR